MRRVSEGSRTTKLLSYQYEISIIKFSFLRIRKFISKLASDFWRAVSFELLRRVVFGFKISCGSPCATITNSITRIACRRQHFRLFGVESALRQALTYLEQRNDSLKPKPHCSGDPSSDIAAFVPFFSPILSGFSRRIIDFDKTVCYRFIKEDITWSERKIAALFR